MVDPRNLPERARHCILGTGYKADKVAFCFPGRKRIKGLYSTAKKIISFQE